MFKKILISLFALGLTTVTAFSANPGGGGNNQPSQTGQFDFVDPDTLIPKNEDATKICTNSGGEATSTCSIIGVGGSGSGDVVGPASATNNAVTRFDETTGKLIQNSGVILDDSENLSGIEKLSLNSAEFQPYTVTGSETGGTVFFDAIETALNFVSGLGPIAQIPFEDWVFVYNDTGVQIENCRAVYPVGSVSGLPSVALAKAETHVDFGDAVLVTTMTIPDGTMGIASVRGEVNGCDTSAFSVGETVYLSGDNAGLFENVEPSFPDYSVQIGGVNVVDPTSGVIQLAIEANKEDTVVNFWNGVFRETFDFRVTSTGGVITGSLEPSNGHDDMTMIFSDGFTMLDTSPAATIVLTAGTDDVPQTNYVYIPETTKVLTVSTSGWATTEHIKVATIVLRTAASTATDGALRNQNWNDAIENTNTLQGHLSHIGERIRALIAEWDSGAMGAITGTPTNVYVTATAGEVYQMHLQTFPAQDMSTGDDIHVVNDPTSPYRTTTNLNDITVDAEGVSLNNRWFSVVVWGIANKTGETSHLMVNLPIGSYTAEASAVSDALGYSVYSIPPQFKGTGFLIGRFTMRLSGGSFTYNSGVGYQDLRGFIPNSTAGSGAGSSGITEFLGLTDTPSSYVGEALKTIQVNAGETGLEFVAGGGGGLTWGDSITDTTGIGATITAGDNFAAAGRLMKYTASATQNATTRMVEYDFTPITTNTVIGMVMNVDRGIGMRLLDSGTATPSATITGFQIDPNGNLNTNSTVDTTKLFIGNAENVGFGKNSGLRIDNKATTAGSAGVLGSSVNNAALGINQIGADGSAILVWGNNNVNSTTHGIVNYTMSNTQGGASIFQKIDMGTSSQAHTALQLDSFSSNSSATALKIRLDNGATFGKGSALEISGIGASTSPLIDITHTGSNRKIININQVTGNNSGSHYGFYIANLAPSNQDGDGNPKFLSFNQVSSTTVSSVSARTQAQTEILAKKTATFSSGTFTENYDNVHFRRESASTNAGATYNAGGSILKLENITTPTAGTLTDTVATLELSQDNDSDGGHILFNSYSGTPTTDGVLWFDGTDLKIRAGGTTYTLTKT